MTLTHCPKRGLLSHAGRLASIPTVVALVATIVATCFVAGAAFRDTPGRSVREKTQVPGPKSMDDSLAASTIVLVERDTLAAMDLVLEPVSSECWPRQLRVTGRLELNASRVADVSSLVSGIVQEVHVRLGDTVQAGEPLARVHSREVGEAKLHLAKAQLDLDVARKEYEWHHTIDANTRDLLDALQRGTAITDVETQFAGRPIGSYRGQLLSAAALQQKAMADYERVRALNDKAIVAGKEVLRIESEVRTANASYGAMLEQTRFESERALMLAKRQLNQAQATLASTQAQLRIFGYSQDEIANMRPLDDAGDLADYPLRAPQSGVVIRKHLVSGEYIEGNSRLVEIADLTTIWLRADIFEKDLDDVDDMEGRTVHFWSPSYKDQRFEARVFALGHIVDDATRAAHLLAEVDNRAARLKPGMFVEIELPRDSGPDVVHVPASALQHHAGEDFVFVRQGEGQFERRDVTVGRTDSDRVEIADGVDIGEMIVVHGGFDLKSEMLSELMVEE